MKENFNPLFALFIGTNGTGKTTQVLKAAHEAEQCLIIPPNLAEEKLQKFKHLTPEELQSNWKGIRKFYRTDYKIEMIFKHLNNCLLIVDDFKNYIPNAGILPAEWQRLLSDRRHRNIDIILTAHSPHRINPAFFDFAPTLVLFNTTRPINTALKDKILQFDNLVAMQSRVNQQAKKNPYHYEVLEF